MAIDPKAKVPFPPRYLGLDPGRDEAAYVFGVRLPEGAYMLPSDNAVRLPDGDVIPLYHGPEGIQAAVDRYAAAVRAREEEPKDFMAFCQAQFPDLIECYRNYKKVRAQLDKFAGKAER